MSNIKSKKKEFSNAKLIFVSLASAFFILIYVYFLALGHQWIIYFDKSYEGQLVETATGKPIEGAVVVALWELEEVPSTGPSGYAKIKVLSTDNEGRFKIPAWIGFKPWKLMSVVDEHAPRIVFYKPGYKADYEPGKKISKGNVVKVERIYTDKEIWKNHKEFRSKAGFPSDQPRGTQYSKKQLRVVLDGVQKMVEKLPNNIKVRKKIIKDIESDQKYWVEGKR